MASKIPQNSLNTVIQFIFKTRAITFRQPANSENLGIINTAILPITKIKDLVNKQTGIINLGLSIIALYIPAGILILQNLINQII